MSIAELLGTLRDRSIELNVLGDRLKALAPPGALTPELSEAIREHKAELLELLKNVEPARAQATAEPIPRLGPASRYPLSFTQQRGSAAARGGGGLPTAFRMVGALSVDALERTLGRIVSRHDPLRSRFHLDDVDVCQEVLPEIAVPLPFLDLSSEDESARLARLQTVLRAQQNERFDVATGPLFRFHLTRMSASEHVLFASFSALIFDGWSFDVFWQELREGYSAFARNEPWPLPELEIAYADFVDWQQKQVAGREEALAKFWRARLGSELPPLPLPTDRPRPRAATDAGGGNVGFSLPPEADTAMRRFARAEGITPQMVMLAALYVLVARLGGESDIVVACPIEARVHPSTERLIGPFVNLLLLRTRVDTSQNFRALTVAVRDLCLAAYDHQDYPTERLRIRSRPGRSGVPAPAFQVEFSYQQVSQRGAHMGALALSQLELESGAATNDLTLWVKDWGERIGGAVEFKPDLYDRSTVAHWAACYASLVRELATNPERAVGEVELVGAERAVVEASLERANQALPSWIRQKLANDEQDATARARVVDDRGSLQPLGALGWLEIVAHGRTRRTSLRAKLTHDGSFVEPECEPDAPSAPRVREAPKTDLETQMTAVFRDLLGATDIGVTDEYFDLGGNSLLAVSLFAEIHQRFGVRLPLTTILEASTPRSLARRIQQGFRDRESCLVKLKAGSGKRALFLVHDADGEALLYMNLARRMSDEVSVYGIEPLPAGRVPIVHTTLEAMAAHYVTEIRSRQPVGPYFVGGLCAGGLIAFEVARQLEQAGERIGLLALFEAAPPHAKKRATVSQERWQRFSQGDASATLSEKVRRAVGKIEGLARYESLALKNKVRARTGLLVLRHVFPKTESWPEPLPPPTVREVFLRAEAEYVASPLTKARVLLVRSREGSGSDLPYTLLLEDEFFGWREVIPELEVIDVEGGHSTMLQEPNVAGIASVVRAALDGGRT